MAHSNSTHTAATRLRSSFDQAIRNLAYGAEDARLDVAPLNDAAAPILNALRKFVESAGLPPLPAIERCTLRSIAQYHSHVEQGINDDRALLNHDTWLHLLSVLDQVSPFSDSASATLLLTAIATTAMPLAAHYEAALCEAGHDAVALVEIMNRAGRANAKKLRSWSLRNSGDHFSFAFSAGPVVLSCYSRIQLSPSRATTFKQLLEQIVAIDPNPCTMSRSGLVSCALGLDNFGLIRRAAKSASENWSKVMLEYAAVSERTGGADPRVLPSVVEHY